MVEYRLNVEELKLIDNSESGNSGQFIHSITLLHQTFTLISHMKADFFAALTLCSKRRGKLENCEITYCATPPPPPFIMKLYNQPQGFKYVHFRYTKQEKSLPES